MTAKEMFEELGYEAESDDEIIHYKKRRQDQIARQIQKEYTALSQLEHQKELGMLCVQHGITKSDLFELIERKRKVSDNGQR